MNETRRYFLGVGYVVTYIVIASAQSVALNHWLAQVNVFLVVCLSFLIVTLIFAAASATPSTRRAYRRVFARPRLVAALNAAAVFNWLFYFLAVKYLDPSVAVTLTQGIGAVSMSSYTLLRGQPVSYTTRGCHLAIFILAAAMCTRTIWAVDGTDRYTRPEVLGAILIAVLCSVSITATVILSKAFARDKVPATVVLSIRFPLLVATCGAALPFQRHLELNATTMAVIAGVALAGIATSTYVLQRGVELAPAITVSTCLALSPLVVFVFAVVASGQTLDTALLAMISAIVAASIVSIVHDGRRVEMTGRNSDRTDKPPSDRSAAPETATTQRV